MASNLRSNFVVFQPKQLNESKLPMESDVVKAILYEKQNSNLNPKEIAAKIATDIEKIWANSTIPITSHQHNVKMVSISNIYVPIIYRSLP